MEWSEFYSHNLQNQSLLHQQAQKSSRH
ncbi:uncharacterized protein METZ01_LOCUS315566 [marine metagenome]|uniref:Uncharacterized protein n=1 Tax=marine metagenome TaxID=408172 RepID=A0A382NSK8_9ZZZZ